jgi:hypothetical protein
MATTRKPRTDWFLFLDCFFTSGSTIEQPRSGAEFHLSREIHRGRIANAGLPTKDQGNRHVSETCMCLLDEPERPGLSGVTIFFRIQQFREAGVFLKESKVFVVARVEAICGA